MDKQQDIVIIDETEVKHPVNAVDCNHTQDAGHPVTCDKCLDKHICLWEQ